MNWFLILFVIVAYIAIINDIIHKIRRYKLSTVTIEKIAIIIYIVVFVSAFIYLFVFICCGVLSNEDAGVITSSSFAARIPNRRVDKINIKDIVLTGFLLMILKIE